MEKVSQTSIGKDLMINPDTKEVIALLDEDQEKEREHLASLVTSQALHQRQQKEVQRGNGATPH